MMLRRLVLVLLVCVGDAAAAQLDVLHYDAIIEPDIANKTISGTVRITFVSEDAIVEFDCGALTIDAVRLAGNPVKFTVKDHRVRIEVGPGKVLTGLITRIAPEAEIVSAVDPASHERLIDLAGVTFLDAAGIGTLVVAHRICDDLGVALHVHNANPFIVRLFAILGVSNVLGGERPPPEGNAPGFRAAAAP